MNDQGSKYKRKIIITGKRLSHRKLVAKERADWTKTFQAMTFLALWLVTERCEKQAEARSFWTKHLGLCPHWGLNPQPLGVRGTTLQPMEPPGQGGARRLKGTIGPFLLGSRRLEAIRGSQLRRWRGSPPDFKFRRV